MALEVCRLAKRVKRVCPLHFTVLCRAARGVEGRRSPEGDAQDVIQRLTRTGSCLWFC